MNATEASKLVTDVAATAPRRLVTVNVNDAELHEGWWESDPDTLRTRFAFPMCWATGNASTAVLYVELEPGCGPGRHTDSPEELLFVLEGEVEVEVGGERGRLGPGGLALVPALVPHQFRNVGSTKARVLGFFSSNVVVAEFEEVVQPVGRNVVGTPTPEMVAQASA
jgi:quercetin dioxygenase-like cupin family protein